MLEVFIVHYRDTKGTTHKKRIGAFTEDDARRSVELFYGPDCIDLIVPAEEEDGAKIRPLKLD